MSFSPASVINSDFKTLLKSFKRLFFHWEVLHFILKKHFVYFHAFRTGNHINTKSAFFISKLPEIELQFTPPPPHPTTNTISSHGGMSVGWMVCFFKMFSLPSKWFAMYPCNGIDGKAWTGPLAGLFLFSIMMWIRVITVSSQLVSIMLKCGHIFLCYNTEQLKVCYSNSSVIQMSSIKIPTVFDFL